MKPVRIAFSFVAILLIVGVIAVVSSQTSLLVTTRTEELTTTTTSLMTVTSIVNHTTTVSVYENIRVVGNCTAVSYDVPDTVEVYMTNVTITSGNTTMYSISEGPPIYPSTGTYGATRYTTSSYANQTSIFVVTSTSTDLGAAPSSGWTVFVCSYRPA